MNFIITPQVSHTSFSENDQKMELNEEDDRFGKLLSRMLGDHLSESVDLSAVEKKETLLETDQQLENILYPLGIIDPFSVNQPHQLSLQQLLKLTGTAKEVMQTTLRPEQEIEAIKGMPGGAAPDTAAQIEAHVSTRLMEGNDPSSVSVELQQDELTQQSFSSRLASLLKENGISTGNGMIAVLDQGKREGGRESLLPVSDISALSSDVARGTTAPIHLHHLQMQTGQSAAIAGSSNFVLPELIGSTQWENVLGKKMLWMKNNDHHVAEFHVNPAELGPLKLTLTMKDHHMQALFMSDHHAVRAALEAALPQLRSHLAESGINLGHTHVGADSREQQQREPQAQQFQFEEAALVAKPLTTVLVSQSMIDTFV